VLVTEDEEQEVEQRKLNEEVEDIDVGDGEDGGGRCLISASCGEESDGDHGGEATSEYRASPSCGLGRRLDRWPELTERGTTALAAVEEFIVLSSVGESLRSVA